MIANNLLGNYRTPSTVAMVALATAEDMNLKRFGTFVTVIETNCVKPLEPAARRCAEID